MERTWRKLIVFLALTIPPAAAQQPTDLIQEALRAYRSAKFDLAIEKYRAALKAEPKSAEAYAGITRSYLKQENVQSAFETASKGLSEAPGVLTHVAMGEVYFRQGKMGEAEREFLQGVNTQHPDARACLGLVRLYNASSLYAHARKMLEQAHQLDSDDPDIQKEWMTTLKRPERIHYLETYLAGQSDDRETREAFARYLNLLKEVEKQSGKTCRIAGKVQPTETELRPLLLDPTHLHGYGLAVKVNGQSSRLLLDTGASGILINSRLAKKAGITALTTIKLGGIGDKGPIDGYIGYANSIRIGDLEFRDCLVEVSEKRSVLHDDGLIGADVFGHFLVTIDFLWQKLKLAELPKVPGRKEEPARLETEDEGESSAAASTPDEKADNGDSGPYDRYVAPEMQGYTKIWRFGHNLLIPTWVSDVGPKLFLIDTGAVFNAISPEAAKEVTKTHHDAFTTIRGLSGSVKNVYSADKAVLKFSHYQQENQDVTAFDLSGISSSTGTEVSGILGFVTLRQFVLTIDYRDGLVDLKYTGDTKR